MSTEAGREGLAVWDQLMRSMTGGEKVAKAFERTEMTRQLMRAGMRRANPNATEPEIHQMYIDRLLHYHGTSLAEVRHKQAEASSGREGDAPAESRPQTQCPTNSRHGSMDK